MRVHWRSYSVEDCGSRSTAEKYGIGEIRVVVNSRLVSSFQEVRRDWTIGRIVQSSEKLLGTGSVLLIQVTNKNRLFLSIYSFFTYIKISGKTKGVCWRMYFKALVGIICEYIVNQYMEIITSECDERDTSGAQDQSEEAVIEEKVIYYYYDVVCRYLFVL